VITLAPPALPFLLESIAIRIFIAHRKVRLRILLSIYPPLSFLLHVEKTQNPAGITASRIHFQKPNLKVYLVISVYAISIIIEPDIHSHNLRAKKMGNVILYVTITI